MHDTAYAWVERTVAAFGPFRRVVEFGGRNVNGGVRDLFAPCDYHAIDIADGPGVDEVADAAFWKPKGARYDAVVCCEVLEHTAYAPVICDSAFRALQRGGMFLITAAAPGRAPHSGIDGGPVRPGEFYDNVDERHLTMWLRRFNVLEMTYDPRVGDIYALARREA